ncbi:MAG: hypothetical protein AB7V46_24620 [Thermomicrobiales bacterium]
MVDSSTHDRPLLQAAEAAADRGTFIAYGLYAYKVTRRISDEQLALEMEIDLLTLDRLSLCLRNPERTRETATVLAAALGIDLAKLTNTLNAAEATLALRGEAQGMLAAARRRARQQRDGDRKHGES